MTNDLLSQSNFDRFKQKDTDWFLDAVASTITDHCRWHIAPSVSVTDCVRAVGNKNIVMLPSLYVTSVEAVRVDGLTVDRTLWIADQAGYITLARGVSLRNCRVSVDFTHGYDKTPQSVAEVGFELAATAQEKAYGVATDLTRGPTRISFKEFGIVLSDSQIGRLGPYTLRDTSPCL